MTVNRGQRAGVMPVPAPTGGLNARDALANMPVADASALENLFPYVDRVETRPGFVQLADTATVGSLSFDGFVQLMSWAGGAAVEQVFGVYQWNEAGFGNRIRIISVDANGSLATSRDVIASGAANSVTSVGEWSQFGAASGKSYLFLAVTTSVGGFLAQAYDGTAWTSPAITGVPADALGVHSHRNRLWFYNNAAAAGSAGALSAYYLPTGAIAGAVTEFNMAPFATKGGRIVAMRTWTRDGGLGGSDDLAVFLTNRGQALVYEGIDPAASSTWELVGVFDVGPVACLSAAAESGGSATPGSTGTGAGIVRDAYAMKYGADLLLNLQTGVTSANRVFQPDAEGKDFTLSSKIRTLLTDASKTWMGNVTNGHAALSLWKLCFVASLRQLFVCIPTSKVQVHTFPTVEQTVVTCYAMNTESGAWTKFTGLNARDMLVVGNAVYFIDGTTKIFKYDGTALNDAGTAITFECRQAYNYLNSPNNKLCTVLQPMLRATGDFSMALAADADYNSGTISSYTAYSVPLAANIQPELSPAAYGRAFSAHMKGQTSAGVVSWYATNWLTIPAAGF